MMNLVQNRAHKILGKSNAREGEENSLNDDDNDPYRKSSPFSEAVEQDLG